MKKNKGEVKKRTEREVKKRTEREVKKRTEREVKKRTEREGNTLKGKNEKERGTINRPKRKGEKRNIGERNIKREYVVRKERLSKRIYWHPPFLKLSLTRSTAQPGNRHTSEHLTNLHNKTRHPAQLLSPEQIVLFKARKQVKKKGVYL